MKKYKEYIAPSLFVIDCDDDLLQMAMFSRIYEDDGNGSAEAKRGTLPFGNRDLVFFDEELEDEEEELDNYTWGNLWKRQSNL